MNERFDLTGRTVIITGGGKGIGKVYTQEFAKAGARVVAADVDGAAAKSVVEALAAEGLEAIGLATDIAREDSTNVAARAPRDNASMPSAPLPAYRSSTLSPSTSPSMENNASRTRAAVGRVSIPRGASSLCPLSVPAITRTAGS